MLWLIVYPLAVMFIRLLFPEGSLNTAAFENVFGNRFFWEAVRNTFVILSIAGTAALVVGTAFAWINERTDAHLGVISRMLPLLPLLLPSVALSIGWIFLGQETSGTLNVVVREFLGLFGIEMRKGPLNIASWPGLIFVYALHLVPFVYLIVSAAFRNLDPALEEAARTSGAGTWRTLRRISMPAVLPSIVGSALLIVIVGMAMYSVPVIIGTAARIDVLSVMTVRFVRREFPPRTAEAVIISLFMMVVVGSVWIAQQRVLRRQRHATIGGRAGSSARVALGRWRWPARATILLYVALTSVLPFAALFIVALQPYWSPDIDISQFSLSHFRSELSRALTFRALKTSVTLGVVGATIGITIAAVLMEYARERKGLIAGAIEGTTKLPGAITNIVIGVGFVVTLGAAPFSLHGTAMILLLAYIVIYMPQASVAAGSAIGQVGTELIEAGRTSGAGKGRIFRKITFPLMRSGLAAGWALVFVVMVGDLTASALLAGTSNPVVGFVILDIWENGTYSALAALASVIAAISTTAVMFVLWLGRDHTTRRRRDWFRRFRGTPDRGSDVALAVGED